MINNSQPNVKKMKSTPYDSDYILPGLILVLRKGVERPIDIIHRSCAFCNLSRPVYKLSPSLNPPLM